MAKSLSASTAGAPLVSSSPRAPTKSPEEVKSQLNSLVPKLSDNTSGKTKLALLNQLLDLSTNLPANSKLSAFYSVPAFVKSLRPLISYRSRALRITAIRVFRLFLRESEMIQQMLDLNMHYLIAWSLEKEKQPDRERIQALKFVRKLVEVDCSLVPRAIIQALVSVAEAREDPLSRSCLNVLIDIAIRNPKAVSLANGIRTLCSSVVELIPLNEGIQDALITAILYLLSDQSTRKYINPNDIRLIVSPLTDVYNLEGGDKVERWRISKRAVVMMLKSWSGLFALATDPIGLKSIVEALRQPALELNEIVLEALFEIFRLAIPKHDPFTQSKKKTDNSSVTELTEQLPRVRNVRHNTIDNFIAILLYAFINNGVVQALIDLGNEMRNESKEDTEGTTATKQLLALRTTVLIGELLYLSNTHLPTTQCARLQTLPGLVNQAVSFTLDPRLRSRASTMTTYLYQYSHIKGSSQAETAISATGPQKWRKRGKGRRLARIEEVKMKMDYKMDEATFQQKLRETNVLVTKDYQRWKWDLIADLLRGPLTNPVHVTAALKTKFIKRLLSFLRPSNGLFANIPLNQNNLKYARIACHLLEVLVTADVGQAYLNDNRLVPQIAEHLKIEVELAQNSEKASKPQKPGKDNKDNRLLGKERVLKTMAREYFTIIGTLSSSTAGLEILNKHKVFEQLSPMSVLPGRDDLSHPIMTSLDYNMPGAARILLAKSLTATSKVVRYLATRHLGYLLRSGATAFPDWGIMFLVKQLSDEHGKVVIEALQVLDEACDDIECLESLIARKPNLMNLGKEGKGKEIMIRFLSRNSGFQYLYNETNLIQIELQSWRETEYINYALNVEKNLQSALQTTWKQKPNNDDAVYLPPHFYGELAQTTKGCEVLKQSGHFPEFVKILKDENSPALNRRGALWVIGHVGKSMTGLDFLKEADIIPYISNLAIKSTDMNIRGTCVFVFGLISKTEEGKTILERHGWESAPELNVCVPKESFVPVQPPIVEQEKPTKIISSLSVGSVNATPLKASTSSLALSAPAAPIISVPTPPCSAFLKIDDKKFEGLWPGNCSDVPIVPTVPKENPIAEVLLYIGNLSNHITTDSASKNIKRLKTKEPELFRSKELIVVVLKMLEHYKFRLAVRQFIYSLFDISSLRDEDFGLFQPNSIKWT
eukprot:TRINITY_DN11778_c0_g1_i1.p2 TRINITY_DN11778_c0_g1~~TRINITY_DN11778_c0_g1_i1.p2  ORF type:complete len:1167 (-),score=309.88 TRINITY_DN11778_c0_g1_i1:109-3609(-)